MNRKTFVETLVQAAALQVQYDELVGLLLPDFSYHLKHCRESSKLTLKEAAARIGKDPHWVVNRESGVNAWNAKDALTALKAWAKPAVEPKRLKPGPKPMSEEERKRRNRNREYAKRHGTVGMQAGGKTFTGVGWSGNQA